MGIPLELQEHGRPTVTSPRATSSRRRSTTFRSSISSHDEVAALRMAAGAVLGAGRAGSERPDEAVPRLPGETLGRPAGGLGGRPCRRAAAALAVLYAAVTEAPSGGVRLPTRRRPPSRDDVRSSPTGWCTGGAIGTWWAGTGDRTPSERSRSLASSGKRRSARRDATRSRDDFDPHPRDASRLGDRRRAIYRPTVRFSPELRWWAEQNLMHDSAEGAATAALTSSFPVVNLDALISWVIGFSGQGRDRGTGRGARGSARPTRWPDGRR